MRLHFSPEFLVSGRRNEPVGSRGATETRRPVTLSSSVPSRLRVNHVVVGKAIRQRFGGRSLCRLHDSTGYVTRAASATTVTGAAARACCHTDNANSESPIKDLAIELDNRPGALAEMGEALGRAGVSIEGGGAWVVDGRGVAHFLFVDATRRVPRSRKLAFA